MSAAAMPQETAAQSAAPGTAPVPRKKKTFMLHHPETYVCLGKYVSTTPRLAALKAASRKHTDILLRETNTKILHHFEGGVKPLDQPQVVTRGTVTVTYTNKPFVKSKGKPFIMSDLDTTCDDATDMPQNPKAE